MDSHSTFPDTSPAHPNPPPHVRDSNKSLNISFSNIRGFRSNFTSVQSFVHINSLDLLALSESRLGSDTSSDSFKLPGYIFHRLDHPPSHGLGVYIKDTLPIARERALECNDQDYICFRLSLLHSTTYLYFLYCSPSSLSCAVVDAISDSIDRVISLHPAAQVMVFRDFNVHHKKWLIHSHGTDAAGTSVYNFSITQGLTQIVSSPTHIPDRVADGRYLLDLFCAPTRMTVQPKSYHQLITLIIQSCLFQSRINPPQPHSIHSTVPFFSLGRLTGMVFDTSLLIFLGHMFSVLVLIWQLKSYPNGFALVSRLTSPHVLTRVRLILNPGTPQSVLRQSHTGTITSRYTIVWVPWIVNVFSV